MNVKFRMMGTAILIPSGLAFLLWIMLGLTASAQQFQYLYGGLNCVEAGYGGVQSVSTGGYIAAGTTYTPSGCNSSDIYVVRTNNAGAVVWTRNFNIKLNDSALDVMECANGDFIVCGITSSCISPCMNTKIFLIRLTPAGGIIWARTYGPASNNMVYGWDVIEAKNAPGAPGSGTAVGDFIVAGWAVKGSDGPGGTYTREAYLMRANGVTGQLVWGRTYSKLQASVIHDDYFYSLTEASGSTGDVIAVGGSRSWNATGNLDAYAVRVNGGNGATLNSAVYTGNKDEELRSVQQLTNGNVVMAGWTTSTSQSSEIYVMELQGSDVCNSPYFGRTYGDNGLRADLGLYIRQILTGTNAGNLIVTGGVTRGTSSGNQTNAFLLELQSPTLLVAPLPSVGFRWYGGNRFDLGWSVSEVTGAIAGQTPGFIVAGLTQSPSLLTPGDPQQMYLIKTNTLGVSGCNEGDYPYVTASVNFPRTCVLPSVASLGPDTIQPVSGSTIQIGGSPLCTSEPPPTGKTNNEALSSNGSSVESARTLSLVNYPNPVVKGRATP